MVPEEKISFTGSLYSRNNRHRPVGLWLNSMDSITEHNLSKVTKAAKAVLVFMRCFAVFAILFTVFSVRVKAFEYASQYSAEIYDRSNGL